MTDNFLTFSVQGEPVPKQSFRVSRSNGRTGGFTDARVKGWQETVAWEARMAMQKMSVPILTNSTRVRLVFKLGNRRRVDLDNLSKAVLDAMNGVVWKDDTQINELHLSKSVDKSGVGVTVEVFS